MTNPTLQRLVDEFREKFPTFPVEGDHSQFSDGIYVSDVEVLVDFLTSALSSYGAEREQKFVTDLQEIQTELHNGRMESAYRLTNKLLARTSTSEMTSVNGGTCNKCGAKNITIAGEGKIHVCGESDTSTSE